jgi:hypothetical protein
MTREEFVQGYMARSKMTGWRLEGDLVHISENWKMYALPCRCGEDGCEGWAMVTPTMRGWHLYQNTDDVSLEEGEAMDEAAMEAERPGWRAEQKASAG